MYKNMKIKIILLLLFLSNAIYSQIQFYNHSVCDKYTIRLWDKHKLDSLKIPEIKSNFSINTNFDLKDTISDQNILKNIKSNILINKLHFYFKACFENNCSCALNLEHAYQAWINKPMRIICLGYFKPNPDIYSLIIQIQYPNNDTSSYYYQDEESMTKYMEVLKYDNNNKYLIAYVLNFDNSYKLISTGILGEFMKNNDGLSYLEIVPTFSIKKNTIIVKEKTIHYPTDLVMNNSKSNCTKINTYKIRINNKGQIEK
jgi:hypothetical protein